MYSEVLQSSAFELMRCGRLPGASTCALTITPQHMAELVDDKGFFWWGWHRHYDVFQDRKLGHAGNPHEIHAIHDIQWDQLWAAKPSN